MVCKGNITFQSFECDYNEVYEAYDVDGDIKNDVQVLTDHYTYSGYYTFLNSPELPKLKKSFSKYIADIFFKDGINGSYQD